MSCAGCAGCVEQPADDVEFTAGGIFVKQMAIAKAGTAIPQHSHAYDHMSMLAAGSVRVWKDGVFDAEYTAPTGIFITAGVKHAFLSLEDNTVIYCVHKLHSDRVEILEEHQFEGAN